MRVTNTPPGWTADSSLMELSEVEDQMTLCDVDFCKHLGGNTNNKWHVCERKEGVNIYPQPKVAEWDIVLGSCNSNPESTIWVKHEGVKSVCTRLILSWLVTMVTEPIILQ